MKEQINKNFKLALVMAVLLLIKIILGIICVCGLRYIMYQFQSNSNSWGLGYGLGAVGLVVIWVVAIIIPSILALLIFVFALVAKKVYEKDATKVGTYRVLMGVSYAGQIIFTWQTLPKNLDFSGGGLIAAAISAYLIWAIFNSMRATYTDRIKG